MQNSKARVPYSGPALSLPAAGGGAHEPGWPGSPVPPPRRSPPCSPPPPWGGPHRGGELAAAEPPRVSLPAPGAGAGAESGRPRGAGAQPASGPPPSSCPGQRTRGETGRGARPPLSEPRQAARLGSPPGSPPPPAPPGGLPPPSCSLNPDLTSSGPCGGAPPPPPPSAAPGLAPPRCPAGAYGRGGPGKRRAAAPLLRHSGNNGEESRRHAWATNEARLRACPKVRGRRRRRGPARSGCNLEISAIHVITGQKTPKN
ncbi:basic proline-rich protein-like isoform X2 [Dermochelys coriacea]|uniref:basic proline-rich protein-like isoform X2 n=1 Tax=Dermochelys coriacea TaxID=27794 RepID=UPI0018E894E3|nr:basic proline-rich protein-like isoform X2 [Dermochelys coriacea]